jgi:hypothetical protein
MMQPRRRGPAGLAGISLGGALTALSAVLIGAVMTVAGVLALLGALAG